MITVSRHWADYRWAGWQYAHANGHAVLKTDTNWRLISGCHLRWGKRHLWLNWRRTDIRP